MTVLVCDVLQHHASNTEIVLPVWPSPHDVPQNKH